jgi:hypothetical protein
MADVDAFGQIIMRGGSVCPLARTDILEDTEEEIFTDSNYVGSQQTAGTFVTQTLTSHTAVAAGITAENDVVYCAVKSAGKIKLALPVSGLNGGAGLPAPLPYPKQLVSGDQVMCMASAAASRDISLSVACSNGEYHIFTVTPSGASASGHELVSILTGLSVGSTLQGRTVTHAFCMGGNNAANFSSPVYFVNGSGTPIASVTPNDPAVDSGKYEPCLARIALNTRALVSTDA